MRSPRTFATAIALAALLPACNESMTPAPPALGAQIDRMGRAGVNTAVTDPFNLNSTSKGANQDGYNAAASPAQWGQTVRRAASPATSPSSTAWTPCAATSCWPARRRSPAATTRWRRVLADDQIYVNSSSGTCNVYLAVEANAIGIANNDCGGRTPLVDTIDRTYSVLAAGTLAGVTDGVDRDADGTHSTSGFPFLLPPN